MRRLTAVLFAVALVCLGVSVALAEMPAGDPATTSGATGVAVAPAPLPPDLTVANDPAQLLDALGGKLNVLRTMAVAQGNGALVAAIDSIRDMLTRAWVAYKAGDMAGAQEQARAIMVMMSRIVSQMPPMPMPPMPVQMPPRPPDSTITNDAAQLLDALGGKLDMVRAMAVAQGNRTLVAAVDSLRDMLTRAWVAYKAGDTAGAQEHARMIMDALSRIVSQVQPMPVSPMPMPPVPSDSVIAAKLELLLEALDARLDQLRSSAAVDDSVLLANVDQLWEVLQEAESLYDAGDIAGARALAEQLAQKIAGLIGGVLPGPMPPVPAPVPVLDSASVARALARERQLIDTLAVKLADLPLPAAKEALARASALADSAALRLSERRIRLAAVMVERIHEQLGRIRDMVELYRKIAADISRAPALIDTLLQKIAGLPLPHAAEQLARASALVDTVKARLDEGRLAAASFGAQRLRRLLDEVAGEIRRYERLVNGIARFREKLAEVEPTITASGDSAALAAYARAVAAIDTADARLAAGRVRAAEAAFQRAYRSLERAIFIATAPERAKEAIAALRARVERLLTILPATAERERAIVERAGQLADSAQAALDGGDALAALRIVDRTNRALDKLLTRRLPPGPIVIGLPVTGEVPSLPVEQIVAQVRQVIGWLVAMRDSVAAGSANGDSAAAVVNRIIDLAERAADAYAAGNKDEAMSYAVAAYQAVLQGLKLAGVTATLGADDPMVMDLAAAGDRAASLAPATVSQQIVVPTDWSITAAPNPFNPSTKIRYTLAADGRARLVVYNALGQPVRVLVDDMRHAGTYEVQWDGRNSAGVQVASGIYIAHLTAGGTARAMRLILGR